MQVDDGRGGTDTTSVTINVTDVPEDAPPAPDGVSVSLADGTFSIGWDAVNGAARYEAQHRTSGSGADWTALPETTGTSASFSLADGVACGTTYEFRVRAYRDGAEHIAEWGPESSAAPVTTAACVPPSFEQSSYDFTVRENSAADTEVGTVVATDEDTGDTLAYAITAGNIGGVFAIGSSTGVITVAGSLDHETTASYMLTVKVDDGSGDTDTASVTVTVTDEAEDPPSAPGGLDVSLANGTFSISWDTLAGATRYEAQHRTGGGAWTALATGTGTSATFTPAGVLPCGTTYDFRVRAYGDGAEYIEEWGVESGTFAVATEPCNRAPEFGAARYALFIGEDTAVDTRIGTVSATDADGDGITYSITAGNGDGQFALNPSTGAITVNGAFDYAETASYELAVLADDGNGGSDTATVKVTLTIAECSNGIVVPQPGENPRLVRDCSVLLTAKDTLRGDATLNWSADTYIRSWQGFRVKNNRRA